MIINGVEYITVKEASKISGYCSEHIRRLAIQKRIDSMKVSTTVMIDKDSLEHYVDQSKQIYKQLNFVL